MSTPSPADALTAVVAAARANTVRTQEVAQQIKEETDAQRAAAGTGQQGS